MDDESQIYEHEKKATLYIRSVKLTASTQHDLRRGYGEFVSFSVSPHLREPG